MARPEGFEPPTPRFVVWYSVQLSYGRLANDADLKRTLGISWNSIKIDPLGLRSNAYRRKREINIANIAFLGIIAYP